MQRVGIQIKDRHALWLGIQLGDIKQQAGLVSSHEVRHLRTCTCRLDTERTLLSAHPHYTRVCVSPAVCKRLCPRLWNESAGRISDNLMGSLACKPVQDSGRIERALAMIETVTAVEQSLVLVAGSNTVCFHIWRECCVCHFCVRYGFCVQICGCLE